MPETLNKMNVLDLFSVIARVGGRLWRNPAVYLLYPLFLCDSMEAVGVVLDALLMATKLEIIRTGS